MKSELFWAAFHDTPGYRLPPASFACCTFTWEITGEHLTRVAYKSVKGIGDGNRLTLTALRLNISGEEKDPADFANQGIRPYHTPYADPAIYTSLKEVLDGVVQCGLDYSEGVVVVDRHWNRIAVTHPEYNTARALREQLSLEWIVNNVRSKNHLSLYTHALDWTPLQAMIARCYADLIQRIAKTRDTLADIKDDAEFTHEAKCFPYASILLRLRFKEIEQITDGLREVPWQDLLGWLEVPDEGLRIKGVAA